MSLLALKLRSSGFEYFACTEESSIGIHISGLNSFLKQVKILLAKEPTKFQATKNDQLSIFFSHGSRECCFILEDGQRSSTFEMKVKKFESNPLLITEVGYGSEWSLNSQGLLRVCRDLKTSMSGENIHIVVSRDTEGHPKLTFKSMTALFSFTLVFSFNR